MSLSIWIFCLAAGSFVESLYLPTDYGDYDYVAYPWEHESEVNNGDNTINIKSPNKKDFNELPNELPVLVENYRRSLEEYPLTEQADNTLVSRIADLVQKITLEQEDSDSVDEEAPAQSIESSLGSENEETDELVSQAEDLVLQTKGGLQDTLLDYDEQDEVSMILERDVTVDCVLDSDYATDDSKEELSEESTPHIEGGYIFYDMGSEE